MSIEAEITVTLAQVEVADDYRIALTMREPVLELTHTEAEQLAAELLAAVVEARAMLVADFPVENLAHGFDVAPICKECEDGHHGACVGSAYIENGLDIDEVECGCSKVEHRVLGGVS